MFLHAKLEITSKNKKTVLFNTILPPMMEAVALLLPYSNYLAVGRGGSETDETQETLEEFSLVQELVTESFNHDPSLGELFVKKKWVLDETNQTTFVLREFGLTAWPESANPKVVNRFVVGGGEPIYRDAGEEMSFELTIYFKPPGMDGDLVLTAGDNPLIASFLGESVIGGGLDGFMCARGSNKTPTAEMVEIEFLTTGYKANVTPVIEKDEQKINFSINSNIGPGIVYELLVVYAGKVVMRSNTEELFGQQKPMTSNFVANFDNTLVLNISGISEISSVTNETTGETLDSTAYTIKKFATGFLNPVFNPFGEGFDASIYEFASSRNGKHILFYKKDENVCRAIMVDGTSLTEYNSSSINFDDMIMLRLTNTNILMKCYNETDGTYSVKNFWADHYNYRYRTKYYYLTGAAFMKISGKDYWRDFQIADSTYDERTEFVLVLSSEMYVYCWGVYLTSGTLNSSTGGYRSSWDDTVNSILLSSATPKGDTFICSYSPKCGALEFGVFNQPYKTTTNNFALEIVTGQADEGFPQGGKNHIFSFDGTTRIFKLFNLYTEIGRKISMPNVKKLYVSGNFDYICKQTDDNDFIFQYVDGDLNFIDFSAGLPESIDKSKIIDLKFLSGSVLLFMEGGSCILVPLNENKYEIGGIAEGESCAVSYVLDAMPGASGDSCVVQAEFDSEIES